MKAFILAAGRGVRMRPLTDTTPKPLLCVAGKPLIVWHLERLAASGFREVVINLAHLGEQIEAVLGDGKRFGVSIRYSPEPPGALETAGGIAKALPLLGDEPFLVINGDVWCNWDFKRARALGGPWSHLAHLVMVANPPEHADGDFCLDGDRVCSADKHGGPTLTYAGTGVFSPGFFASVVVGSVVRMRPLLDAAIAQRRVSGERHDGEWVDVGSPERLAQLDTQISQRQGR